MKNQQGLSLTEVLVSLCIASCSGLLFLKQHWTIERLYQQLHLKQQALFLMDDLSEQRLSKQFSAPVHEPFKLKINPLGLKQNELLLSWPSAYKPLSRVWF